MYITHTDPGFAILIGNSSPNADLGYGQKSECSAVTNQMCMIIGTWSAVVKDFGSLRLVWAPDHIHVSIATYKAFLRYIKVHHKYESWPSPSAQQFLAQC